MTTPLAILENDPHDQVLKDRVRPPDWKNPKPARRYNLVVLGAGTAGLVSAAAAAGLGARVALVEKNLLGGDCLNFGCVPSKALIRSARAASEVRHASEYGIDLQDGTAQADFSKVMSRVRRLRAEISQNDSVERFSSLGVDVFLGKGSFVDQKTVQVGDLRLRFKRAVIATGARPASLKIPGLESAGYLTNETVFSLNSIPSRLLVIGGGPIGCELAQAFARLGSRVTLVEAQPQFLAREDPDAAEILAHSLTRDQVEIRLSTRVATVSAAGGQKRAELISGDRTETMEFDQILVGIGRIPNVEDLNLQAAGVHCGSGGIQVNDRLQTSNSKIFAAGDVCLPHKFTHTADASARIVIQNALFFGSRKVSALTVPWCTYTSPEIAHVGLYEEEARSKGIEVTTFKVPFSEVDRAILDGEDEGFVKIHVKKGTDEIIGATIVAEHAGELISELSVAIAAGIGLGRIANVIHPYPTQAEAIRKAADAYNRTRLTPFLKRVLQTWFSLTR
jgi:pyruvate/2-oxoglutarate dehydrogenase complex dihydrolipoamide dehydrogenase (E3) component